MYIVSKVKECRESSSTEDLFRAETLESEIQIQSLPPCGLVKGSCECPTHHGTSRELQPAFTFLSTLTQRLCFKLFLKSSLFFRTVSDLQKN